MSEREKILRRERDEAISQRLAGANEKVQMYNLGGEYPELPTRLLAWPDFCTEIARAEQAEAQLQRIKDEANRVVAGACIQSWSDDIRAREQAEAQRDVLAKALREIGHALGSNAAIGREARRIARKALALDALDQTNREEIQ